MLSLLLYFLLALVIVVFEVTRKRYFKIDHISLFNFFFLLVYVFTPIELILNGTHLIAEDMPYGAEYFGKNPFTASIVFSSYLLFLLGYQLIINQKQHYTMEFQTAFNTDAVIKLLPFIFLLLFAFMFIYTNEFGGLKATIEQAKAYRSGALTYHKFGFVQRFFPLNSILLYYLFYKVVLEKNKKYRKLLTFFLLISALFTILTMAIYSSRGFVIFELVGLYILTAIYYKNYFLKYLIPSILVAFIVIKYGNPITNSLSDFTKYGVEGFINAFLSRVEVQAQEGTSIISNFTHPIVSLEASLQLSGAQIDYRYFKDILYAFLSLLPNELLGIKDPQSLMQLNTLILQGKEVDQILPGALGFFSYSLNVIGVFIGSFVYGIFGGYLYKLFIQFYKSSKTSLIYIYFVILTFGYFVFRGTPTNVVQEKFMVMVVLFLIFFFSKIVIRKVDNPPTS